MPRTDISTRASVVSLKATGMTSYDLSHLLGISTRTIDSIYARAIQRGFDPAVRPLKIQDSFLADAPRSGRPIKRTKEAQEEVLSIVRKDRYGREKTCTNIAANLASKGINILPMTVFRILKTAGLNKIKPTRKPGLTQKMKKERLD